MATKRATARRDDIEVLPAINPDVQLVASEGDVISAFLGNLAGFFSRATELESAATGLLADTKARYVDPKTGAMKWVTNGNDDLRAQQTIKTANAAKKTHEEHWDICQVISRVHLKMTGKRRVGVQALEEVASIAQRVHNRWVDDERRRVQMEEDRLRREEEARQREAQERQARELEEQALAAETTASGLSEREQVFVELFCGGATATAAATRAGYKDPAKQGSRLLETEKIQTAIKAKQDADAARRQAEAIRRQPVAVEVERPAMDVVKTGTDRTTWSGEIVDERIFVEAAIRGGHGIPSDCLMINQTKLNEYARSLLERLDLWPGVRAKKTTKTI